MYDFKTKIFGRVAVATLLSLGLTAGAVSVASAATHPANAVSHASVKADKTVAFQGVVTALPAGFITVVNADGTSKTFTITATTKILRASNVKNPATLAVNDRVEVRALASAPLVATSINILAAQAVKTVAFKGVVTALPAGFITVVNANGTSKTFTITATTKMLHASNVKHSTLAVNDRVVVRALASAPLVATSINNLGIKK
jgi:putative heme iron utilization protein